MEKRRKWAKKKIRELIAMKPIFVTTATEIKDKNEVYINIRGTIPEQNNIPLNHIIREKWTDIQAILTLLAGKAHEEYNKTTPHQN